MSASVPSAAGKSSPLALKLHTSSLNALLLGAPAVPAAFVAMKVGQVVKVTFFEQLSLDKCDNKDLLRTALIIGTSVSLISYWPAILSIKEKIKTVKRWKGVADHPGYFLLSITSRFATLTAACLTPIALAKIENTRNQMLACGIAFVVQGVIWYKTPSE